MLRELQLDLARETWGLSVRLEGCVGHDRWRWGAQKHLPTVLATLSPSYVDHNISRGCFTIHFLKVNDPLIVFDATRTDEIRMMMYNPVK